MIATKTRPKTATEKEPKMPAIDSTPTVTVLRRGRWTHHPHWFLRPGPNGRLMTLDADGGCVGSWHATDVCPHMDGTA